MIVCFSWLDRPQDKAIKHKKRKEIPLGFIDGFLFKGTQFRHALITLFVHSFTKLSTVSGRFCHKNSPDLAGLKWVITSYLMSSKLRFTNAVSSSPFNRF